jgi:hypothetical protein
VNLFQRERRSRRPLCHTARSSFRGQRKRSRKIYSLLPVIRPLWYIDPNTSSAQSVVRTFARLVTGQIGEFEFGAVTVIQL